MKEFLNDIRLTLHDIQLWFEREPLWQIVARLLYLAITVIVLASEFFIAIDRWPRIILFLLSFLLIFIILIIDLLHMRLINLTRINIEEQRSFISELLSTQPPIYKVKFRHEYYDIESDGDATYHRTAELEYAGVDIAWAEIWVGSTSEYGINFSRMRHLAKTYPDLASKLTVVPIQKAGSRLRTAIVLRQKITRHHLNEGFFFELQWPEIWKKLIDTLKDDGTIRIDHDTEKLVIEVLVPHKYKISNFTMPRTNGQLEIFEDDGHGRSYMTYTICNLRKGEQYSFFLEIVCR